MISSNYSTAKNEMISIHSDMYKDAYGCRPTGINFEHYTVGDIETSIDALQDVIERNMTEEHIAELACIEAFNSLLAKTISMGAGNRETALRWLYDGSGIGEPMGSQDLEHFIFQQGILCTKEGDAVVQELIQIYKN